MENKIVYKYGVDNIFDFHFMDDFTTVILFKEEYGGSISNIHYENEDDFYCFSEKKVYTEDALFKKFNIQKVA